VADQAPHREATAGDPAGRGRGAAREPDEDAGPLPTLLPRGAASDHSWGGPADGAAAPPRRRSLLVVAGVGLGVVVVAVLGVRAAVTGGGTGAAGPTPTPAAASANALATASAGPGNRAGVDAPGSDVQVTLNGDGLDVEESAVLDRPATSSIALTLPDLTRVPALNLPRPIVTGLAATVDGRAVTVQRTASGWTVPVAAGGSAQARVTLRYGLAQAVVQDASAAAGRALLVVTPLTGTLSQQGKDPVVVRVAGAQVREAACLTAPVADQLCGWAGTEGWVARVPSGSSLPLVVFQVDRPA